MRKGPRHAGAVAAASPCSHSSSNAMASSPALATVTASGALFGGDSPAATSSPGCRQPQFSRGSLNKAWTSSPSSASCSPQQQQQRRMRKGPNRRRSGGGGRGETQMKRLPNASASEASMSTPKVPPQCSRRGRRNSGGGDVAAGVSTIEDVVQSVLAPQSHLNMSSSVVHTTSSNNGNEVGSSSSPLPRQQQQRQRPPDQLNRAGGKRYSKPREARDWTSTQLQEEAQQNQQQHRQLQSRQSRRRLARGRSEGSVKADPTEHNLANEEELVAGDLHAAAAVWTERLMVSRRPRHGSRIYSPSAKAAEVTLENEELLSDASIRRAPSRSAKKAMTTSSRRSAATEGGRRSRHRRRLSPAHPVASSPTLSRESSINEAVSNAAVDEAQPLPTVSRAEHAADGTAAADSSRPSLRAGSKPSRKQKRTLSTLQQQHPPGFALATAMTPVTAIAAFSPLPPLPFRTAQDPTIAAQQVSPITHTVVAEPALPVPSSTVMQLAEFSSVNGSVVDPCVVAAVLPASAGGAAHTVNPAVRHGVRMNSTEAAFRLGPPTVEPSYLPPPQQESEEEKQLSRRGLRFGAIPFYPSATASLGLAMTPAGGTNGRDALLASLAVAVPSPQPFLGSYSMSPARSPPLMQPNSSPLGDSIINRSQSSTGGLMSGQSAFTAESTAAAGTPWTLTVDPLSHSSPPSSLGRDDADGDGVSSATPSVPLKSPAHGFATSASNGSNTEIHNAMVDRPAMWRSALMVTNTATGALLSPATVHAPSGSPTVLWSGGGGGNGSQTRASKHGSGTSSLTAALATTTSGGTGHRTSVHSASTPDGDVVREFPQAPYLAVNRTTEPHQPQHQHPMFGPRVLSESDLDRVRHNRVAVSDVVAKDEGTLVDTLFADVNMIEDDESEVDGEDALNSRGGGERWSIQLPSSSVASSSGSPLAASSPDARTPHSTNQQSQHRPGPASTGVRMLGKEAGGQIFGGGYWYPSGPWAGTDAPGRGSGSSGIGTGSYRASGGDAKTSLAAAVTASIGSVSVAAGWRGLSTPPHRHRDFSASCTSVASTISLIDPKQPQADGAAYDMAGEDDEWEMNSSAYADSLDEAQIQWIEEQLRATENPAGYF
ncbi:hypothetical protein JIQ42_07163 [Leishmania sp. Namibia]|uniref:hypothetical protein n=1 Tax=Leishmania sp. Namibia TaxID=2802991 RepID=UPI001B49894F|nr:hypothetical protein JIQ42_07163 [Leishmania sp. Namibia]